MRIGCTTWLAALAIALAMLLIVADFFARGAAAAVQNVFYLALLGFVIGVLRLLLNRR